MFEATARLYRSGAELLEAAIGRLALEELSGDAPNSAAGSYQSWPSRGEVRALHELGHVLIHLGDFRRLLAFSRSSPGSAHPSIAAPND